VTNSWFEYLLVFVGSTGLCAVLTPLAIKISVRSGVFDYPGDHKAHQSPVPYLGGAAIVLSFAGAVTVAVFLRQPTSGIAELVTVLSVAGVLAVVGLADDLAELSPIWRLVAEVCAALIVWFAVGGVSLSGLPWLDFLFTVFWIVGVANAFNLLDNMDGLAAGLCAITSMTYFAVASSNGQFLVAALSIGLAGCGFGFLKHNFHPARIYMGDSGALFIGFMIAYLGLKLRFEGDVWVSALVPILACSVAIFDTTLVVISRLLAGLSPFQGGQDHISHRLVRVGLPVPVAVGVIYFGATAVGVNAFVISRIEPSSAWILAGLIGATLVVGGFLLLKLPVYPDSTTTHYRITKKQ